MQSLNFAIVTNIGGKILFSNFENKLYLNQYKIAVPVFGAANAASNKGTTISY